MKNEEENFEGNKSIFDDKLENNNVWLCYYFFVLRYFFYLKKQFIFVGKNLN